ncbi:hypothetical protein [Burkholderia sp. 22313]|uniref:hypothetical protein n=1 Tax=Burkholderia sp. 22313 TaxID=3453908 RepID=UPI003F824EBC
MGRIRTVKPEFPQSESMGRVSRDSRLTFLMLFTIADDEGRLRGNSRMLASLLFPYDEDAPRLIDDWLSELEVEGCIVRYQAKGASYIEIRNWLIHQKIDKPSKSKIPAFDDSSRKVANPREGSFGDQGSKDQGKDLDHTEARASSRENGEGDAPNAPPAPVGETAALLSQAFRERGVQCTPSNPDLITLVEQGVSLETAIAAAEHARIAKPDGNLPLRYVTRILEDWAKRPAVNAAGAEAPAAKGGGAWWRSDETALAMANQVGVGPARAHESRTEWHARVQAAIDNGGKPPVPAQAQRQPDPISLPPDERTGPSDASRSAMGSISSLLKAKVSGGGIPA